MAMNRLLRLRMALFACLMGVSSGIPSLTQAQKTPPATISLRLRVRSGDGVPIGGAEVRLGPSVAAESDEGGVASFARVTPGDAWLRVRRIGYRPDSLRVFVSADRLLDTSIVLQRVAVDLAPVTILGRRDVTGPLAGFYQRMASGGGRYFNRADIARRAPQRMTELLREVPGIRIESTRSFQNNVRIRGARCGPAVWLDGQVLGGGEVDLDSFDLQSFEGIEVYSGAATVPVEFQRNMRSYSNCGAVLLWSRRGEVRPRSTKGNGPSPAARIAQLLDSLKIYTAADVDIVARMDSSDLVHPVYPDSLYDARTPGLVLAEFVVGADGDVIIETFNAVTTTHRLFVDAVQRALQEQRFVPAMRQGRKVQQVVQQPFRFVPDSTARRRR